jgi:hypothetical protein
LRLDLGAQRCGPRTDEIDLDDQDRPSSAPALQRQPATRELVPIDPLRRRAVTFLKPYDHVVVWDVDGVVRALVSQLSQSVMEYAFIRAVMDELPDKIEDDVAAAVVDRLPMPISVMGLSSEGRALLDVFYEAIITGDVSDYQRKQANKIMSYRIGRVSEAEFVTGMDRRMIFPIRNIGVTRLATATFRAGLQPNGKVKLRYTSVKVMEDDMFAADRATLPSWTKLSAGIELDPNQLVAVHLFDVEKHPVIDLPALALIDYSNQIEQRTLSTAGTAFFLGLTLGMGALGGGAVGALRAEVALGQASKATLWAARALLWADRVQFGIQAGAMIINDHRDWIVETFPGAGPGLLDAVDTANRVAGYYGWGRLGLDGLRMIRAGLGPAVEAWRSARATARLDAKQARVARAVEDEADALLAELQHAEQQAAGKGGPGQVSPPVNSKVRKTASGGEREIHVTDDRIEICPVQRCPDLRTTVGPAIADPTVAAEVVSAEKAAATGRSAAAADLADAALADARAGSVAMAKASIGPVMSPTKPGHPINADEIAGRGYPLGFAQREQFVYFGWSGKAQLSVRGITDGEIGIQGSAVTGYSASGHGPFDGGRISDIDTAVVSPTLFARARSAGIGVRDGHTRFAITAEQAAQLQLSELSSRFSRFVGGRKVNIMIFESRAAAMSKESATMWHWY